MLNSTNNGAELYLLIEKDIYKIGFEIKYMDNPRVTKSMHIALKDLSLNHLYLIIPGEYNFSLAEKLTCICIVNISIISANFYNAEGKL